MGTVARGRDQDGFADEHGLGDEDVVVRHAEVLQQPQRVRRQPVAAGLVAGEVRLVDAHDVEAVPDRGDRGRRAGRAGSDHDDVDALSHRRRRSRFSALRRGRTRIPTR